MIWTEIKHALNSSLGRIDFVPLNELIIGIIQGSEMVFDKPGPFTASIPAYVTKVELIVAGAGGGGTNWASSGGGYGGGGGACVKKYLDIDRATVLTGTVGKGGLHTDYGTAGDGTATVVDGIVTAAGGKGAGDSPGAAGGAGGGAGGASGKNGSAGLYGAGGEAGSSNTNDGGGGGGSYGKGGKGGNGSNKNGENGIHGGGGGGGRASVGGAGAGNGGDGGDGIVIIRWGGLMG